MSPRFLLLPAVLFLAACDEKNSFAPPPPMPVGVQKPIVRSEQTYSEYSGRIEALQVVEVRARVKGRAERRAVRQAAYLVSLEGDRAGMFAEYGRPAYRYYELRAGKTREYWTYPEHKFTVVFVKNRLVDKRWF